MALAEDEAGSIINDGINEEFFRLMWLKDELNFGPSLNIPDTIVVKYGQPTSWYFTAQNGRIKKKNRQNLMNARIEEIFTKHILGYDVIATFVNIYIDPDPDTGVVPPSTVEFLDLEGLNNFLYNRPKEHSNGVLQRFIEPKGTKNEMIRAVWSPKVCLLERAGNIHHLHDHRYGLYERCVTLEGPEYYIKSAPLRGPVLAGQIQKMCESIVTHISEVTFAQKEVTRMVLNFKVDSRDKIWLCYSTSVRLHDMMDRDAPSASSSISLPKPGKVGRKLVNIDSVVQLPNTVNLNPTRSYEVIKPKKRIRCISCAKETLEDVRHPITYKSIIKHYEHVIHIMTEICANQHTTVLEWPPDPDIIEAAGGVGFGCLQMVPDDDVLAKSAKLDVTKPLDADDLRIPPILRYLHPKLTGSAYYKCCRDPLFLYKTAIVCEPCYLVFAEFTTMLLRMGGDLSKLLTPDPAAVNMSGSLAEDSMFTKGTGRPSEADWRAMSTLHRSSSDSSMRRSKDFNPSANHRQAKATAIGLRTSDSAVGVKPKMPKAVRQTKDMGPLQGHSYSSDSHTQHSLGRSMNMSQASHTTPSQFEENEEIRHMVAERERNFFKEISMNPQLKDQHPLMHLISAQQKLKIVDEQSGVLMSNAAKSKKSMFGTSYGKQGQDKYAQYAVYAQDQPYIMKGKLIAPAEWRRQKEEKKAALLAIKEERMRKKAARQAEMKMTGASSQGDEEEESVKHLGRTGDGDISLVSAADSEDQVVDNSKSAKKHRNFLRDTLKEVEGEIVGAMDYIKVDKEAVKASKKEVAKKSNVTDFELVPTGNLHRHLTEVEVDNELPEALKNIDVDRPGTTSTAGRPTKSAGGDGYGGGGGAASPGTTGYKPDDMFSVQSASLDGGGSMESDLLANWGGSRPLKEEKPAGLTG